MVSVDFFYNPKAMIKAWEDGCDWYVLLDGHGEEDLSFESLGQGGASNFSIRLRLF